MHGAFALAQCFRELPWLLAYGHWLALAGAALVIDPGARLGRRGAGALTVGALILWSVHAFAGEPRELRRAKAWCERYAVSAERFFDERGRAATASERALLRTECGPRSPRWCVETEPTASSGFTIQLCLRRGARPHHYRWRPAVGRWSERNCFCPS